MKIISLDSLRGIAALSIVFLHSPFKTEFLPTKGFSILVDFFFILSGFVIALSYSERIKDGYGFKKYALSRFSRIYPLHIAMLFVWLAYLTIRYLGYIKYNIGDNPFYENNLSIFLSNIFLLNGFLPDGPAWNYPSWSISVEFYSYFLMFFILKFVDRKLFYLVISVGAYTLLYKQTANTLLVYSGSGAFLRCFAGVMLGMSAYHFRHLYHTFRIDSFLLITICCAMVYISPNDKSYQIITILFFSLLIISLSINQNGMLSKLLSIKPLEFIGKISYSIYLTHAIILSITGGIYRYVFKFDYQILDNGWLATEHSEIFLILSVFLVIIISSFTYKYLEVKAKESILNKLLNKNLILNRS